VIHKGGGKSRIDGWMLFSDGFIYLFIMIITNYKMERRRKRRRRRKQCPSCPGAIFFVNKEK